MSGTLAEDQKEYLPELKEKRDLFVELVGEMQSLSIMQSVATWDIETKMPKSAAEYRGWAVSNTSKIIHEKLTSDEFGKLIKYLRDEKDSLNKVDKAIVRVYGKEYDESKKVPVKLVQELSELTSKSHVAWAEAKEKKDFEIFAPCLDRIFEIKKEIAHCIGFEDTPYDAHLNSYEEGMRSSDLDVIFSDLKSNLVETLGEIKSSDVKIDEGFLKQVFSHEKQIKASEKVLEYIGYDFKRGRLDESSHPFSIAMGPNDVRVTTKIDEENLLFGLGCAIHEGGHAIYELGVNPELRKLGIGSGTSLGIHESQSRLYETIVGQGMPFWKGFYPALRKVFSSELKDISLEQFYNAMNVVRPSLIRVKSDEVTYNLHIVIRYEIERALLEGKINVKDIPEIWNEKMETYLGIKPSNIAEGALQDVHWSWGAIGYFPTYTIGNLCAAQFYNTYKSENPNAEDQIAKGSMAELQAWLNKKIHHYGMLETPVQIVKRVTGEDLNSKYFTDYINKKYSEIYNL